MRKRCWNKEEKEKGETGKKGARKRKGKDGLHMIKEQEEMMNIKEQHYHKLLTFPLFFFPSHLLYPPLPLAPSPPLPSTQYLEKNGITEVTRDNFSFSSKIPIGEYVEAGTQVRRTEGEVRDKIQQIREQKGYKPMRRHE